MGEPMNETIYALGFFDGVHIGHAALLKACRELAAQRGCRAGVVTFGSHPDSEGGKRCNAFLNWEAASFAFSTSNSSTMFFSMSDAALASFLISCLNTATLSSSSIRSWLNFGRNWSAKATASLYASSAFVAAVIDSLSSLCSATADSRR